MCVWGGRGLCPLSLPGNPSGNIQAKRPFPRNDVVVHPDEWRRRCLGWSSLLLPSGIILCHCGVTEEARRDSSNV